MALRTRKTVNALIATGFLALGVTGIYDGYRRSGTTDAPIMLAELSRNKQVEVPPVNLGDQEFLTGITLTGAAALYLLSALRRY